MRSSISALCFRCSVVRPSRYVCRVSPAQFHEYLTIDDTAGMEIALRSDRRGGDGGNEICSECVQLPWHCEWTRVESPNTDMAGLYIESKPCSQGLSR